MELMSHQQPVETSWVWRGYLLHETYTSGYGVVTSSAIAAMPESFL